MSSVYESYAIYGEFTRDGLDTQEMTDGLANRIFNVEEASYGDDISIVKGHNNERIRLQPGVYRISAVSFVTMLSKGAPPVPPVPTQFLSDVYPGYCMLYDANDPPTEADKNKMLCAGTMGTAYDGVPSIVDYILKVKKKPMDISLGHQCSYDLPKGDLRPKVYLRIGGSEQHVCARISIFKIGSVKK
jgi:hypothetical protein